MSLVRRILKILGVLLGVLALLVLLFVAKNWAPDRPVEELTAKWAKAPSTFIEVGGMRVHLRDEGPRDDATPIVLLHGTSASLHTWEGWAVELRRDRRVIRFDLPGFGLTGPRSDGDYTIESYARFMRTILDQLGIKRCVIAGNSFGGYVALATALDDRGRVVGLVLVDSGGYPFAPTSMPLGFKLAQTPVVNRLASVTLPRRLIESSLRNVYGDPSKVTPPLVDLYFDLATRAGNRRALVERFKQAKSGAFAARIPEITAPTLVVWGGRDRLIPRENGDRFAKDLKNSKLVVFDDLGHVPQEEDPARTVSAVRAFLPSVM